MKAKPTLRHILAALGCASLALSSASAQADGTWIQDASGTHAWSDIANWLNEEVANGADATAFFTESADGAQTASLDIDVTLGNLTLARNQNLTINTDSEEPKSLTLDVSSGIPAISVSNGRSLTISSQISGTDGLQKDGGGILLLNGTNDYTGGTFISAGRLHAPSDAALGEASGSIILDGGILHARSNLNTGSGGGGGANISSARDVIVEAGGGGIAANGNNNFTTTGKLSGTGNLTFLDIGGAGGRSLNFNSTDNDFTGGIVIGSNNQVFNVASLVDSANNIAINGTFNGRTGTFRYGAGAVTALTLEERAFEINGNGSFTGRIENLNTTHAITINTDLIATGGGDKTLTLSGASGPTNVFAGVIADETDEGEGTVALTKEGGSTWVLGGDNTYTGETTISAGTLLINGDSSAATGEVAVNGSSTLGGSGTLGGDVTVAAGANLAPGASVGTLSIGGDLNLSAMAAGSGQLHFELGPIAASDQIAVTGTLDIGSDALGFSDFNFSNVGGLEEGVYTLISSGGIAGSLDATDLQGTVDEQEFTLGISDDNIVLIAGAPSGTPYELWADGAPFDGDESGDGVSNGLAFLLGATDPNDNALGLLPIATETAGGLVLTFSMRDAASRGAATLSIEHSSDLGISDDWTTVAVPDSTGGPTAGVSFTVTGSGTLNVEATISATEADAGKLFGRLKAEEN